MSQIFSLVRLSLREPGLAPAGLGHFYLTKIDDEKCGGKCYNQGLPPIPFVALPFNEG